MSESRDEEDELRTVTLENARSIFRARRRAEEELLRTREALWKQSEWLRVTLASIGDAVVTTDVEGRVLSLNSVAERLTGWTQQEAGGRALVEVFRIVDEEGRQPPEDPAWRALREGRIVGLANHTILVARDGTETQIDDSAAPIRDDQGRVHGVVLVFRSIAERKRAEDAVRRSERELADFFENAAVGLHWVGPDGTILRVNRAGLDLLGYSREEYVGHNIAEFHADPDVIGGLLRRLSSGETLRDHEARMRCRDGSLKHVLIDSSARFEGGRFVHSRCFTRDNSDRKRMEETQARLAAIVESSHDAIVGKTLEGRILSWNAAAERLFGHGAQEAIGRPISLIIPPDRLEEERSIIERLRRGERIEHYETVRVSKQGRRIDVSLTISPIRDSAGRIIGASKSARDITARKRAQDRLAMQNGVTRTLAESASLGEAAPRMLQAIGEHLGWQVGALWYVDEHEHALRCVEVYHRPDTRVPRFEAISRERAFERGVGLPGRVWADGNAAWIPDVVGDANFPRAAVAAAEGLHGAFGFPIKLNEEVLGVMEFFSHEIRQPDSDLLETMTAIGSQVGQFIERKRAEEALRESEARFRQLADAMPQIVWAARPDGYIDYYNERWYEYTGFDRDAYGQASWEPILHPDDVERCVDTYFGCIEAERPYQIEYRFKDSRTGGYRWFLGRAVPVRDERGRVVRWFGTCTDIDTTKHAEETTRFLADASAALAELTDSNSTLQKVAGLAVPFFADWCAVDVQDADGSVRRLAITHRDPARVRLAHELFRRYPPRPSDPHGVAKVLRTGESEWAPSIPDEMLLALAHDDEHLRAARQMALKSSICVPLRSRGRTLGALTFATAESGRVYHATDVAAAEDLAHRAVIAIESASVLAALKEADRRKDEFLAMLAHELRNPLAPIRNAVQIFRAKGPPAPELQWATEVIDRQAHQMTRLVDDLLDVSRITRGEIELRKERVELATIVSSAVEASRPLITKWGHQLTVTIPPQPIQLEADPTRLAQVLSNLLNNAAKYTDQDGRIGVTAELQGNEALIRVGDNGTGIHPEDLPRIFDPFTQAGRSSERSEGGLGIGLTLVKRLVEMHGGAVEARSEGPGKGSEFTVRLPVAVAAGRARSQAAAVGEEGGASPLRRILVVDDNLDAADSLGMVLRMMGHEVHTAHDGFEAVGAAAAFRPDVILLDIGLPKLSGYDAARRLREQEGGTEVLLVALSGWGQEEDRRLSKEAGFDLHVTKPVEFDALRRLLAETGPDRPQRGGTKR